MHSPIKQYKGKRILYSAFYILCISQSAYFAFLCSAYFEKNPAYFWHAYLAAGRRQRAWIATGHAAAGANHAKPDIGHSTMEPCSESDSHAHATLALHLCFYMYRLIIKRSRQLLHIMHDVGIMCSLLETLAWDAGDTVWLSAADAGAVAAAGSADAATRCGSCTVTIRHSCSYFTAVRAAGISFLLTGQHELSQSRFLTRR